MGNIILIASGKGGTGKSTVTAGLGLSLSRLGSKVCMIDANIGLRDLDFICGLADRVFYNLYDLVQKGKNPEKVILPVPGTENLFLIPAPQTKTISELDAEKMKEHILLLSKEYDFVLIDCPPGCGEGFEFAAAPCDQAILVVTPDASCVRAADKIRMQLKKRKIFHPLLVLNRMPENENSESYTGLLQSEITEILPEDIGTVLYDRPDYVSCWNKENLAGLLTGDNEIHFCNLALKLRSENVKMKQEAGRRTTAALIELEKTQIQEVLKSIADSGYPQDKPQNELSRIGDHPADNIGPESETNSSPSEPGESGQLSDTRGILGTERSAQPESGEISVPAAPETEISSGSPRDPGTPVKEKKRGLFARIFGIGS